MNTIFDVYRHGANLGWSADQVVTEVQRRFKAGTKLGANHLRKQYADTVMMDRIQLLAMCKDLRAVLHSFSPDGRPHVPSLEDPAWPMVPAALQSSAELIQKLTPTENE